MCQTAVNLISKALYEVDNAENLLKIKNLIALFMQTMNVRQSITFSWIEVALLTDRKYRPGTFPLGFSMTSC